MADNKKLLVVRLDEEDYDRLQYVLSQTKITHNTALVRMMIRAASEGGLLTKTLKMEFPPYAGRLSSQGENP